MLREIRILLAVLFFTFITLLFLDFTGTLHLWLGWLAKIQFLPALLALNVGVVAVLALLTLAFGRVYCSVVCPLGVMQDIVSWVSGNRKKKKFRFSYSPEKRWLRYGALAVFIVALAVGVGSLVALLAPYSSYGRIAQNVFQPIYVLFNNALAWGAERIDSYAFYSRDVWIRSLPTFLVAAITLVAISVLSWRNGRTYCNTLCPVGTILSFLARFAWFKVAVDETKCNKCGLCSRSCKSACIDFQNHRIDYSRCVVCGDCIGKCRKQALSYGHHKAGVRQKIADNTENKTEDSSIAGSGGDASRRSFLLGTVIATASAALAQEKKKVDGGLAEIEDKQAPHRDTPLTPPGSLSAENMAHHCTACQLCVAECPNDVLRPSTDLMTFMQPTMSYERGYCRPECNRCSEVCPAGAIHPIKLEDKSSVQIGHAVWIKKNCVPITEGKECGNCARHCPVGAITMVSSNPKYESSPKIPAVNTSRCIGCGACENLCPARPFSAIYVEGHEVHKYI